MTKLKTINIIVCILCVMLALTALVMGVLLSILFSYSNPQSSVYPMNYYSLPDVLYDSVIYISDCFFEECDLTEPAFSYVICAQKDSSNYFADGVLMPSKAKNMGYVFKSKSIDEYNGVFIEVRYFTNEKANLSEGYKEYGGYKYEEQPCEMRSYYSEYSGDNNEESNRVAVDLKGKQFRISVKSSGVTSEGYFEMKVYSQDGNIENQQYVDYCNKIINSFIDNFVVYNG